MRLFRFLFLMLTTTTVLAQQHELKLNDLEYYETRGLNILVFNNWYNDNFSDSKMSGIEMIHHGKRTVTNGDVRLEPTPEQWDRIPEFIRKEVIREEQKVIAYLKYPEFEFQIHTVTNDSGLSISVHLEEPLPENMVGKAGFNLEFLPSAYSEKTFIMGDQISGFPLYPSGPMTYNDKGETEPMPIGKGSQIVIAPEDDERRMTISSEENTLLLYDGRNKAQNGWFVLRSVMPGNRSGKVIEWQVQASAIPGWIREPVIAHSQVGYHPEQKKVAVVELDRNDEILKQATVVKVLKDGTKKEVLAPTVQQWGQYKRYQYAHVDFSSITEPGVYMIEYGNVQSNPIMIDEKVYETAWHPTLDIFFPVQMDHVLVNEAYRVWHGASHLDDALQAPVDHVHFDLYAQGPTTDTPYEPGEHIPGLNVGGWYDAGDFDIRTQSQYSTVMNLVNCWEDFNITRDETFVGYEGKYVDIHRPDGKPDVLQQIEHGTLQLLAQHKAVGHAIPGIIVPNLSQYTHLGDGLTMTDNLIYNPDMDSLESDGYYSGVFDDRWAFTSKSTPLNYGSIAALAAAGRALKGYNDTLANECLSVALKVWDEEQSQEPDIFYVGNTTGGPLLLEQTRAAVELLKATGDEKYANHIRETWPEIKDGFGRYMGLMLRILPEMDDDFKAEVRKAAEIYAEQLPEINQANPFGVNITEGGWAGNGGIIGQANSNYLLYKTFPDLIDKDYVFRGLNYIFGTHPDSNISFVSGVGLHSKKVAYGMNRADFSYIPGGIVPGVLILKPDFPENKEDWPFLWGENEYVITVGAPYIYLVNAVMDLLGEEQD